MERRVELLAPAGNPRGFYGAIHAGADAVYLGGDRFGARAYADNFKSEELLTCIRYAHIWGRRVYLTVNTLVKEAELEELLAYLQPLYEAGLDGVIVQDLGVFACIKGHFPGMELHVSTQMTLTGKYGARLLGKLGAVRIVPARELSLAELGELKSGLQIEAFIHGAMCYCYSGQCLFSSILGGRSGNRGRCAQPCRLPYRVEYNGRSSRECYPLSLKDMCTLEHIPELIGAGIDSFKIEGRMKKPEYAAGVTAIYRKYIDKYYAGEDCGVAGEDSEALGSLYIRSGRQDGYYFRHNGKDMVTLENPSYSESDEILLEKIRTRYLADFSCMPISIRAVFRIGMPARVTFSLKAFDRSRGLPDARFPNLRLPAPDNGAELLELTVEGDEVSAARNRPVTAENIRRQLGKLGDTVFSAQEVEIELDEGAFYPLKAMNELRRQAVGGLEELLIQRNGLSAKNRLIKEQRRLITEQSARIPGQILKQHAAPVSETAAAKGIFHVLLRTAAQLDALTDSMTQCQGGKDFVPPGRIYLEAELFYQAYVRGEEQLQRQCQWLHSQGCELAVALPAIIRSRDERYLQELWTAYGRREELFRGFLARSVDGLGFLDEMREREGHKPAIYTDAGLYIWNHESLRILQEYDLADGFCLPYELRASEQRRVLEQSSLPGEKVVYGRIPLMITANCIVNTTEGCNRSGEEICFLIDRYKKRFPVLKNCRHCMNIIYNSLPLSLHAELDKWRGETAFRLDFTVEGGQETGRVLRYFLKGAEGELPYAEYTTGHEKRGAE